MSSIGLLFCTKQNTISNYGVDVSIFDKCNNNIIFGNVDICVQSLQYISAKSGIRVR